MNSSSTLRPYVSPALEILGDVERVTMGQNGSSFDAADTRVNQLGGGNNGGQGPNGNNGGN